MRIHWCLANGEDNIVLCEWVQYALSSIQKLVLTKFSGTGKLGEENPSNVFIWLLHSNVARRSPAAAIPHVPHMFRKPK